MTEQDLRWAFFAYGNNLGDFTRALETAKKMQQTGADVRFYNHGGIYNYLLNENSIINIDLKPELTWEQHEKIMDINRYKAPVGTPLPVSRSQWIAMAESELEAFSQYNPHGVFAGLNLSCMLSVPYAKLPMVTLVPTVNCPAFIKKGLYNMPNIMEKNFFMRYILPDYIKRQIMKRVLLSDSAKASLVTFNEARKHFGLPPIYNIVDLVKGDVTLLPDLPELSGLPENELTPGYYYSDPMFSNADFPLHPQIEKVFSRPGINVYCSLGSSGFPDVLKLIVNTLKKIEGINLVCATTTILEPKELEPFNDRFFACKYLPALKVNQMADVAVLHGGQGTIQTAVWAGTPVVGIGFQAEQQANIDGLVRCGMGIRIPLYNVTEKSIMQAFNTIIKPQYKQNALILQQRISQTNGAAKAVKIMNDFVLRRK